MVTDDNKIILYISGFLVFSFIKIKNEKQIIYFYFLLSIHEEGIRFVDF